MKTRISQSISVSHSNRAEANSLHHIVAHLDPRLTANHCPIAPQTSLALGPALGFDICGSYLAHLSTNTGHSNSRPPFSRHKTRRPRVSVDLARITRAGIVSSDASNSVS